MSTWFLFLAEVASTPFPSFWFDVGLKATALLLAAVIAAALLRRSSAALRHRLWCLTFAALLLLPALSAALPKWRLAVLPARFAVQVADETTAAAAMSLEPSSVALPDNVPLEAVGHARDELAQVAAPSQPTTKAALPLETSMVHRSDDEFRRSGVTRHSSAAALFWLAGAALALLPLIVGAFRTFSLRRQARPIEDAIWRHLLEEHCRRLAISRRVELLETAAATMPMTWGLLRPVVLLPAQAREWSASLRRVVLLHELAHVKRCDVGFQMLARATCALYWFHPLAWHALRRLRIDRELACDDCVVHAGERASDYAAELLQIARTYRPVRFAAAVAMAQRSSLEHRVRTLFDGACSHLPLSAPAARLLLVGVAMIVTAVAVVGLAPKAEAEDDRQETSETKNAETPDDDLVAVNGRVVDPQGKPFAGARIFAARWYWEPHIPHAPLAEAKSGPDGRFTISYRKSQFNVNVERPEQWKEVAIVATAEGFGPGWVTWRDIPAGQEPTLTLVPDDAPIAGRVVDLEGNPIAAVRVQVGSIYNGKEGSLDGWVQAVRRGEFPWTAARHLGDSLPQFDAWPPRAVTADDGRFTIHGIGRERRVQLSLVGPTIAYQQLTVVTRPCEPLQLKVSSMSDESTPVYGAEFELVAPPSQPITGIVRDAETGQPLAGVSIESNQFAGSNYINERHLRAVSDAQGRYRLLGMPKGEGNALLAVPNDDQPYLMREFKVPESRGLEPVELDIELHRGVWISGRVTDKATGEPLIARLHYLPFRSNEYAQKTPEFGELGRGHGFQDRYASRPDGSFRLVGLPGRAIVGAECVIGQYRDGVGAEAIAGITDRGAFPTYANPVMPGKKWPHAMQEINPPAGTESVVCDLALDPGGKIKVNVLDRDGKPVSGFETIGSGQSSYAEPGERASFDVITLGPDETRTVVIRHKQRKLGKVVRLRLTDYPAGAATVLLEPTGKVVGRLLDKEGEPLSGAEITAWTLPIGDFTERLPPIATDEQGRFEYDHIPVGCHYQLDAQAAGKGFAGAFAKDLTLAPGETKDLGEVTYGRAAKPDQKPAEKPVTGANSLEHSPPLRVRVVDDNDQPIADARVRVLRFDSHPAWVESVHVLAESHTDKAGEAAIDYSTLAPFATQDVLNSSRFLVLADARGRALDWSSLPAEDASTLRLSRDDVPIEGRVLDLEGRPIPGVRVSVFWVQGGAQNIDAWIKVAKNNPEVVDPIDSRAATRKLRPSRGKSAWRWDRPPRCTRR
ncbi:MAG TPA: M56 family metallopeptidase [Pirellulales bacterium]|nr:M56 family metallopeptidase [Pirellulales bacterium]